MNAFLDFLEKLLTWFFSLAFGALLIYGGLRYRHYLEIESDPWLQTRKINTPAAYLEFLRGCKTCPLRRCRHVQRVQRWASRVPPWGMGRAQRRQKAPVPAALPC